jgi:aldose 1-epimerase
MDAERPTAPRPEGALQPLPPGPLLDIGSGKLAVAVAPAAGGRIARVVHDGMEWLAGYGDTRSAAIDWGSYPMVPWAGRIRHGKFVFEGRSHRLACNFGGHAIHGVGFGLPWRVGKHSSTCIELSLQLPEDARWPFGGTAHQRIEAGSDSLRLELSVSAGALAMPAAIGWHPWFNKPDRLEFAPERCYPRDAEGIATLPLSPPPPGPWDDCFVNNVPVILHRAGRRLRLTSSCSRWVVYDETREATCVEPQSGPPDAFNLEPVRLAPGASIEAWFQWEWL